MRMILSLCLLAALAGCGSAPAPSPRPVPPRPRVADDTHHFPAANRASASVVEDHLLGHAFLPGGNIAHYKKGAREYDLILIRTSSPEAAALLLLDYKKHLQNPKVIAHFGGFAGADSGKPAFLFAKGAWLGGVLGLPQEEADLAAREFAARLN